MKNNYASNKNQMSLFGGESEEVKETVEVSVFCKTCNKGFMTKECPPVLTPGQRLANGFIETVPGKWHKQLDACSRQCEIIAAKKRENEEK